MQVERSSEAPATAGRLDFSGAAVADGHAIGFQNDRDLPPALGNAQHIGKRLFVLEHVAVFERNFPARVGLPGRRGVGSKLFAKDNDGFSHLVSSMKENCCSSKK